MIPASASASNSHCVLLDPRVAAQVRPAVDASDFMCLSFYPYAANAAVKLWGAPPLPPPPDQWRTPLDWVRSYTDKPLAMCETGYPTQDVTLKSYGVTLPGTADQQLQFVKDLWSGLNGVHICLWCGSSRSIRRTPHVADAGRAGLDVMGLYGSFQFEPDAQACSLGLAFAEIGANSASGAVAVREHASRSNAGSPNHAASHPLFEPHVGHGRAANDLAYSIRHLPRQTFQIVVAPYNTGQAADEAFARAAAEAGATIAASVPWRGLRSWSAAREVMAGLVRDYRIDLVHSHENMSNTLVGLNRRRLGVPVVASAFGWWKLNLKLKAYYAIERRFISPLPRRIHGLARTAKLRGGGTADDRIAVIYTGIDAAAWLPRGRRAAPRLALGIAPDALALARWDASRSRRA